MNERVSHKPVIRRNSYGVGWFIKIFFPLLHILKIFMMKSFKNEIKHSSGRR